MFDVNVKMIQWEKVAYLPTEIRSEVEQGLIEHGFMLIHSPLGSAYVTKEHRCHPDYKLTQAFLDELENDRKHGAKIKATVEGVRKVISAAKFDKASGAYLSNEILTISGGELSRLQGFLILFFQDHMGGNEYQTYADFRAFCKYSDIPVNNNELGSFAMFHNVWYENEQAKIKAKAINTSVETALEQGDTNTAIAVIQRTHGVGYEKAKEMVKNMQKLANLQKKLTTKI